MQSASSESAESEAMLRGFELQAVWQMTLARMAIPLGRAFSARQSALQAALELSELELALGVAERADATGLGPLHGALLHRHAHFGLGVRTRVVASRLTTNLGPEAASSTEARAQGPHCTDTHAPDRRQAAQRLSSPPGLSRRSPRSRSAKAAKASSVLLAAA